MLYTQLNSFIKLGAKHVSAVVCLVNWTLQLTLTFCIQTSV